MVASFLCSTVSRSASWALERSRRHPSSRFDSLSGYSSSFSPGELSVNFPLLDLIVSLQMRRMESASGPSRHSSVSPHAARRTPYARPATLEEGVAKQLEKRGSGLLGSLMRKGLGWIVGNHQQPTTAARGDEEEAVESRRGGLSRSATMPAIADVNGSPAARPMRRYAPPSVPASLSARSSSPDRPDARRRTGHSTLNLPNSSSSSTFGASRSYGNLRSANESTIFAPIPSIGPSPTDPYHPSTAYLKSNSPFASSGPSMHNLQLRSPSPGVPSPPRSASGGQALYPHVPNSRRRGPSPLNPASERSYAGSAMGRPMAWSPTRGGFSGSRAGSSIAGSSRRGDVFGRGSEVDGIPTVPKNEAERILNVLENLRTPFGGPARHVRAPHFLIGEMCS